MRAWTFHQLDVFTDEPLAGNGLAVFPDARGLDAATMQKLARETNQSETTFVFPDAEATRHVRFFTPAAEIPLAGHPTIGTWWALAELGLLDGLPNDGTATVTQRTGQGVLPVDIALRDGRPTRVVMTQTRPVFGATVRDRDALERAMGGPVLAPEPAPQIVSTAMPQMMAPVVSSDALAGLPSGGQGSELARLLRSQDTDCLMLFAPPDGDEVHCRMFAPGFAVPEDPATGSAAGALGAYLAHHRLLPVTEDRIRFRVRQGIEIGRPSTIHVEVPVAPDGTIGAVFVGGTAVRVITGEVSL